jgi:hypothetical protein
LSGVDEIPLSLIFMGVLIDRLFALTEVEVERDEEALARRFRALRVGFLVAIATEQWHLLPAHTDPDAYLFHAALALVTTLAAPFGWVERWARVALALSTGVIGIDLVLAFPTHANHHYLIFLCAGILAATRSDSIEEKRLALGGLRWLLIIGVFWAGLQKLLYGYYFGGELLAYMAAEKSHAADLFALLLPADELARLTSLEAAPGAGPYRVASLPFVLASNLSVLGELLLPPLLLVRRTRLAAGIGLALLFLAIEIGAREIFFGLIVLQLLLLFAERPLLERALPLLLISYAAMLATIFGLLPAWDFT